MKHNLKFAKKLKAKMANNHLSQDALAKLLNTTQATISRWCSDKNQPDFETLFTLCDILKVSPNDLLGWEE